MLTAREDEVREMKGQKRNKELVFKKIQRENRECKNLLSKSGCNVREKDKVLRDREKEIKSIKKKLTIYRDNNVKLRNKLNRIRSQLKRKRNRRSDSSESGSSSSGESDSSSSEGEKKRKKQKT